jgi:signal transduction histidine kinase
MNGTNHATGGRRRLTRPGLSWTLRSIIFAIAVGLVLLLIVRIEIKVGDQLDRLRGEFNTLEAENFYVGVQMRTSFRRLNERLLNHQLSPNAAARAVLLRETGSLKAWLEARKPSLSTDKERDQVEQVQAAYDLYLAGMQRLLNVDTNSAEPAVFVETYKSLQEDSRPLLGYMDQFVQAQKDAFNGFLQTSEDSLISLQHLLTLSLVLLLASTLALAALVYRGMIAPLRRRLTESQTVIVRQEKLAALGTLAAGVAHEIRNPLAAIKFRLYSLKQSLPPGFANQEDASVISAELNRLERIVKDFLQFARPSEPERVRLPAVRLLEEVCDLLRTQLDKAAITVRLEPSAPVWILADPQQLRQVLINLVQNAADSIGRHGAITLGVRVETTVLAGQARLAAILSVADTGAGIPPEVEKRLFDPFFTTKEGGTGLGLSIATQIVAKHGGLLRYQTQLNRGTIFEVVLPGIEDHESTLAHH